MMSVTVSNPVQGEADSPYLAQITAGADATYEPNAEVQVDPGSPVTVSLDALGVPILR